MTDARVYRYTCFAPLNGWEAAAAERRRQTAFWNTLVEIEDEHVRQVNEAAVRAVPELAATRERLAALTHEIEEVLRARSEHHRRAEGTVPTPELDARLRELRAADRQARLEYKQLMTRWRRENKATLNALERDRQARVKAARQATSAYWGNYNRVLADFEAARKMARKSGRRLQAHDPDDLSRGVLTVQIQRTRSGVGAAPEELFKGTTKLHIVPVAEHERKCRLTRGQRAKATRTRVTMRVDAEHNDITLPVVNRQGVTTPIGAIRC